MANTKTAKENILINERNRKRNEHLKSKLKTSSKKSAAALETNTEDKVAVVRQTLKDIDKSVSKGIIHKNKAARNKSNLMKKLNAPAA